MSLPVAWQCPECANRIVMHIDSDPPICFPNGWHRKPQTMRKDET